MKKYIFCLMFLLSLQLMQAQYSSTTDEVKRLVARAKTAYSMGEYQDALEEYKKAQKLVPNYPDLYKAIGDVYEKFGGDNDLKAAIESYKQYLRLSPNADDKIEMQEKVAALEYRYEKAIQQTQILNELSGLWVSNWADEDTGIPYAVLDIQEIQQTGKYRVTIRPECVLYKGSIIEKTINILPENDKIRITFADAQTHTPSGAKYSFLSLGLSLLGGGDLVQNAVQTGVEAMRESDLQAIQKRRMIFN